MIVLGIESTCDETAFSIVKDGKEILSNVIASQTDLHALYGGVVPEIACRRHIDVVESTLSQALSDANITLDQIDLISVARGPGLIGALLIGLNLAKGLALSLDKPFVGVNHIEAHLYSSMMKGDVSFPALGVILSGAHTNLLCIHELGKYQLIGQTVDDAIGEAFDKVAVMLGLPYPGGPHIEKLAKSGNPDRFQFKAGRVKKNPLDFSFSGLKTAVLYQVQGQNCKKSLENLDTQTKADIAAAFQQCAFEDLIKKAAIAASQFDCKSVVFGGGVTANQTLRTQCAKEIDIPLFFPPPSLSMDNGAMIAALGYHHYQCHGADSLDLQPLVRMPW